MELDTVVAVAELALERNAVGSIDAVAQQLQDRGWRGVPIDGDGSVLDRQWTHEDCWGTVHTGAAGDRAFIGLNSNHTEQAQAQALLRRIGDLVEQRVAADELRLVPEDEEWARWSDGVRDVELRLHPASAVPSIPWGVQFSVELLPVEPA